MLNLLYNLSYALVLLSILPYQYLKRPGSVRARWLRERLGIIPDGPSPLLRNVGCPVVWIHAVSVGEVIASTPLVRRIKDRFSDCDVVVSTVTDTGQEVARERMAGLARAIYVPFDLPIAVKNSLRHIKPSLFIIMETELWPNLLSIVRRYGVPVILMNGRISDRSFGRYMKAGIFIRRVLRNIDRFCMQNAAYAERAVRLGAPSGSVAAIGNLKFDTTPPGPVPAWALSCRGTTIIAGSTHRPEEDLVLDAYLKLMPEIPSTTRLIVAPRHPERFREVEDFIRRKGVRCIRRSEIQDALPDGEKPQQVILLDIMGELASVYGACDIAIMGGSFTDHGGQNLLEPAFWAKPIICGPHMENFPFAEEFFREGGAIKTDASRLAETLRHLIVSPSARAAMGVTAKRLYDTNTGAADRAMGIISPYLEEIQETNRES